MPRATGKGTSTPRSRGAYGSKRGTPDIQNARQRRRLEQKRVVNGLTEAEQARRELDNRIAAEQQNPAVGPAEGSRYYQQRLEREAAEEAREHQRRIDAANRATEEHARVVAASAPKDPTRHGKPPRVPRPEKQLRRDGDPKPGYTIKDARQMFRQGYHVKHVMERTGVGYKWLDDIPMDTDGYARPEEGK